MVLDQFPELSETFVAGEAQALRAQGHAIRIEARRHASTPNLPAAIGLQVVYGTDDGIARKLRDLAWLAARHPAPCARDLAARRRWRAQEPVRSLYSLAPVARRIARGRERHLHVHFAARAALDALRLGRLLGLPYSVMAHAYDIFREPTNLREKLAGASFAATASDFTVSHLRQVAGKPHDARVHKLVLGIDGDRFRRAAPYPGGRVVAAVGRLIEKKGFVHLLDAAAVLEGSSPLERLVFLGDGPLGPELRERADKLGLGGKVEWLGSRPPGEVRALLERADLLAMPCVVARDGDRDSSPVVVKEALAMEVPVVASDGFGIDEVVRPEWGRLVPPDRPEALAEALRELLALPAERRAEMGRAGRAWVLEYWNLHREAERLAQLIRAASGSAAVSDARGQLSRTRRTVTDARERPTSPRAGRTVSILVVTYNHAEEIDACLDAATGQAHDGLDVEVVVVDNASTDGTPKRVDAHDGVKLIQTGHNSGFAAGMNAAFAAARGDWTLLLNPDCVMDPGCVAALRDHLVADPAVVVAAALLRYADGSPQMHARRRTDLATALWAFTHVGRRLDERFRGGRGRARRWYADEWKGGPPTRPLAVFSPAAACVMAARRDLEPRPFDEALPLLFNDEDLYIRLASDGRRVEIVPAAGAAHGYGTSLLRAAHADRAGWRAQWVMELRRLAARHWSRPARATLYVALLADAILSATLRTAGARVPADLSRGTLGGLGLPLGAPPLLRPMDPS